MVQRAGTASLPLHDGQVPKWLADRMTRLGAVIIEAIIITAVTNCCAVSLIRSGSSRSAQ
jgi:hypothetical protein